MMNISWIMDLMRPAPGRRQLAAAFRTLPGSRDNDAT